MADFQLVDPQGWEWDLQSVYSAYMNHFQLHSVPWYDRSWGLVFSTFDTFLTFGWPVICVTDSRTGRPHLVTRTNSIGAFLKMIKTRFGENLPMVDNMLRVTPFETQHRHLRTVNDSNSYKKLHNTLPAAVLAAQKLRLRSGEPKWIQELWEKKDKTFLALAFEWSERNVTSCLEWGYAAVRCSHLDTMEIWPPVPETNYRRGHYIVAEYVDKVHNKYSPTFPWEYAFGESQVVPKVKLGEIIRATISSLASPDSETTTNQLVIVVHGTGGDVERLSDLKVKLPNNVPVVDTAAFERQLFFKGLRGAMVDTHSNKPRQPGTTLSLSNTLRSLNADLACTWHCSGNDAFGALLALQLLLEHEGTQVPVVYRNGYSSSRSPGLGRSPASTGTGQFAPPSASHTPSRGSPVLTHPYAANGYFSDFEASAQRKRNSGGTVQPRQQQKHERGSSVARAGAVKLSVVDDVTGSVKCSSRDARRQSTVLGESVNTGMSQLNLHMH